MRRQVCDVVAEWRQMLLSKSYRITASEIGVEKRRKHSGRKKDGTMERRGREEREKVR